MVSASFIRSVYNNNNNFSRKDVILVKSRTGKRISMGLSSS